MGADRRGWATDPVRPGDSSTRRPTIRRALFAGLAALLIAAVSAACGGPPDRSAPASNVTPEGTPATGVLLAEVEEDAVTTSRPAPRSTSEEAVAGAEERELADSATETGTSDIDPTGEDAPAGSTGRPATDDDAAAGVDAADIAPAEADQPGSQAADTSTASSGTPAGGSAVGNTAHDAADDGAIGTAGHPPVDTAEDAGPGDAAGEAAAAELTVSTDVPDIEMIDLSSGATVSLRSVVSGETPLLFWFWSPL